MTTGGDRRQSSGWSKSQRRVVVGVVALMVGLAIQPAFVPRDPNRQTPFTWEMYAKAAPLEEFEVVSAGGSQMVTVLGIQPRGHANVDYTQALPAFICTTRPDTVEVRIYLGGTLTETRQCER